MNHFKKVVMRKDKKVINFFTIFSIFYKSLLKVFILNGFFIINLKYIIFF